jgi:hypothetical protein
MSTELQVELKRQIAELEQQCRELAEEVDSLRQLDAIIFDWALARLESATSKTIDRADRKLLATLLARRMPR